MEFRGTKGKWETHDYGGKGSCIDVICGDVNPNYAFTIAQVYSKIEVKHTDPQHSELTANAKLIAAAPEMFEMLKDLNEIVKGYLQEQSNNDSYPAYIIEKLESSQKLLNKITQ